MQDRVKIAYSIEIEDLPAETLRLWDKAATQMAGLLDNPEVEEIQNNTLSLPALGVIEALRRQLSSIDFALDDLSNIIQGYIQYQTAPPPVTTVPKSIDELTSKIQEFKEQNPDK